MHEHKHQIYEESDAFIVLPGGTGTPEETIEVISWMRLQTSLALSRKARSLPFRINEIRFGLFQGHAQISPAGQESEKTFPHRTIPSEASCRAGGWPSWPLPAVIGHIRQRQKEARHHNLRRNRKRITCMCGCTVRQSFRSQSGAIASRMCRTATLYKGVSPGGHRSAANRPVSRSAASPPR